MGKGHEGEGIPEEWGMHRGRRPVAARYDFRRGESSQTTRRRGPKLERPTNGWICMGVSHAPPVIQLGTHAPFAGPNITNSF